MTVSLECAAILFDMDGTLVDSTAVVERAWGWWAKRHHIPMPELLKYSHGRPTLDTMEHFLPGRDHSVEAVEMLDYEETQVDGIIPVRGAVDAMSAAKQGRWGVVTSASRRLAEIRLTAAGLTAPRILVAADQISRGKPDPEGYLTAADYLGVSPAGCLVFEDTGPGVDAGRRAGMQVVGLLTTVPREQLACEWVVRTFDDVRVSAVGDCFAVDLALTAQIQAGSGKLSSAEC